MIVRTVRKYDPNITLPISSIGVIGDAGEVAVLGEVSRGRLPEGELPALPDNDLLAYFLGQLR